MQLHYISLNNKNSPIQNSHITSKMFGMHHKNLLFKKKLNFLTQAQMMWLHIAEDWEKDGFLETHLQCKMGVPRTYLQR